MAENNISVIIPSYNAGKYVLRAVNSIKNQTYQSLQIIVVDDGSWDKTAEIIDEIALENSSAISIHQTNHGVSTARNMGLEIYSGEYVGFFDGDDFAESGMYEKLLSMIEKDKTDITICGFGYDHYDGDFVPYCKSDAEELWQRDEMLVNLLTNKKTSCGCWDKIFRRNTVNGVKFKTGITNYEDLLFLYEVMKNAEKASFTPFPYYHYCINEGSAASSLFNDIKMTMIDVYDIILKDAEKNYPNLYSTVRTEYVRNNLMCASFAVESNYNNRSSLCRLRNNVKNNLLFYLKGKSAMGYKIRAVALSIGWCVFRLLTKQR